MPSQKKSRRASGTGQKHSLPGEKGRISIGVEKAMNTSGWLQTAGLVRFGRGVKKTSKGFSCGRKRGGGCGECRSSHERIKGPFPFLLPGGKTGGFLPYWTTRETPSSDEAGGTSLPLELL